MPRTLRVSVPDERCVLCNSSWSKVFSQRARDEQSVVLKLNNPNLIDTLIMSRPQRVPNAPRLVHNLRSSLELSNCIFIDGALKDLKAASRRLRSACAALQDESRVLERLYYKGKNQHRSALFWRHVSEVRRYYRRLEELRLTRVVEDLRGSFFGDLAVHK
jgi:hypothetical protein